MEKDLYQQLTDKLLLTGSKLIPELFKMIADESEAGLLLAMPGTPEQLAEKVQRPADEVAKMCQMLYQKGLAFKSYKGGAIGYKMCRDMAQFHDATSLWSDASKSYLDLWKRFMDEEWPGFARLAEQFIPKAFTRVIPVEKSIDAGAHQVLDSDSANKIIERATTFAVTRCACRVIARKCDKPLEVCIQVDNAAKYAIDRGSGREISREEALQLLRTCEEQGLIHVAMNRAQSAHFICNCCSCCCLAIPLLISDGIKLVDPSRFQAEIDKELCSGCGTCLNRCCFKAIETIQQDNSETVMQVVGEKCMGCGLCQVTCPEDAISLKEVRPADFIPA
jgi:ferredoxin